MTLKLPRIIGHRGVRGYAPENTLVGLHTAADMGLTMVEFDAKLTRDGIPVLFHDEHAGRILGNDKPFKDITWDDLQSMDAGHHFSDSFVGEPVPHLEDALEVCINRGMIVNIEIKPCPDRAVETAETVLDFASRIWPDDMPPPLISSFNYDCLLTSYDMAPGWPRGYLIDEAHDTRPDDWTAQTERIEAYNIGCNGNAATDDEILMYVDTGLPVLSYTINEGHRAEQLFDMGVTAVFSDTPDIIEDAIEGLF